MASAIIGTVRLVQGLVEVRSADGTSTRILRVGDELHEGEIVLTGQGGRVEITLADGAVLPIESGQQVSMTAELSAVDYPAADEAQVASVDTVGGQVTNLKVSLGVYVDVFTLISWWAIGLGVLLLLLSWPLKKWMHGVT